MPNLSTSEFWSIIGVLATILVGLPSAIIAIVQLRKNKKLTDELSDINMLNPDLKVYNNVDEVLIKIKELINEQMDSNQDVHLRNYGLDLETIQSIINVVQNRRYKNVSIKYQGLIVNPDEKLVKDLIDGASNIKTKAVELAIEKVKQLDENNDNVNFDLKMYNFPPIIHGFNINNKYLFLGFTEINNSGKLMGGSKPYLFLKSNLKSEITVHYFKMFNSWFDWQWKNGNNI